MTGLQLVIALTIEEEGRDGERHSASTLVITGGLFQGATPLSKRATGPIRFRRRGFAETGEIGIYYSYEPPTTQPRPAPRPTPRPHHYPVSSGDRGGCEQRDVDRPDQQGRKRNHPPTQTRSVCVHCRRLTHPDGTVANASDNCAGMSIRRSGVSLPAGIERSTPPCLSLSEDGPDVRRDDALGWC